MKSLDDLKIRCSSLGKIMTEPQAKAAKDRGDLSETAKSHLIEIYVEHKYGRTKEITSKYMEKGKECEESSITLYSRLKRSFFKKNSERLTNEFITGEPDLYIGKDILFAERIIDTKSSWDLYSFIKAKIEKVNKDYFWQGTGYMALTGAKSFTLAYCLINTPIQLILDEKRRLAYRMDVIDDFGRPDYIEASKQIDHNCIYDDIPLAERMFEIQIERDHEAISQIAPKVIQCRQWLSQTFYPSDTLTETLQKSLEIQNQLAS